MFIIPFLAAFLTLTWHPDSDAHPHFGGSYCIPGEHGPTGWARTKTMLDTDWRQYVRGIQTDNCDIIAREVRANLNF